MSQDNPTGKLRTSCWGAVTISNRFTRWLASKLVDTAFTTILSRDPDFVVGGRHDAYLRRWWLIPRNKVFNIYLHQFLRDDEDRALHDHPWISLSISLTKPMRERYLRRGVEMERTVQPGDVVIRGARFAHRMIVPDPGALTIFITGPRMREWGFWCENVRFVPWKVFVDDRDRGRVGRGCD